MNAKPCRLSNQQCERVFRVLNAGRRKLVQHARSRARAIRRTDAAVASELLRIVSLLYGFRKPVRKAR